MVRNVERNSPPHLTPTPLGLVEKLRSLCGERWAGPGLLRSVCIDRSHRYPPKKYGGYDHTHLVWAICKECNKKTRFFIQKLGPLPPFRGCVLAVKKGHDANVLLRASLVNDLRSFYKAAERKDYATGIRVVHKSLQFIADLETLGLLRKHPTRRLVHKRGARSVKGKNPIVRELSRKKF